MKNLIKSGISTIAFATSIMVVANSGTAMAQSVAGGTASGPGSVAVGNLSNATTDYTTAVGREANATGNRTTAIGAVSTASGDGSTAVGTDAKATNYSTTAVGKDSQATGGGASAFGVSSLATGNASSAFGRDSKASGDYTAAFGNTASATGAFSSAFGNSSSAFGDFSSAFGQYSIANGNNSSAFGNNSLALGAYSSVFGQDGSADGTNSSAFGARSKANGYSASALGASSNAANLGATAVGAQAESLGEYSSAIGSASRANSYYSTAFGSQAISNAFGATAIGALSQAIGVKSIAFGSGSTAEGIFSIALGNESVTDSDYVLSIGSSILKRRITNLSSGIDDTDAVNVAQLNSAIAAIQSNGGSLVANGSGANSLQNSSSTARGDGAVALGQGQNAYGNGAVAIGDPNNATGTGAVSIGADNTSNGNGSVSLGNNNTAGGIGAVAIGNGNTTNGNGAIAIGLNANSGLGNNVAIGDGALALANNSVAIGAGSVAGGENTFSVGASGNERRISNVQDGLFETDAVNMRQLNNITGSLGLINNVANEAYEGLENVTSSLGGGASLNGESGFKAPTYTVAGGTQHNVGDALDALDNAIQNISVSGNPLAVQYDDNTKTSITLGDNSNPNAAPVAIHNVKEGTISASSTDAINGAQLYATNQNVTAVQTTANGALQRSGGTMTGNINMGGNRVTGLANGTLSATSTDAVTGSQLYATNQAISNLSASQDKLTNLVRQSKSEYRAGIAAAMSMATPSMPSAPGKTSYIVKAASYEGEGAFGISLTHRFSKSDNFAITGAFSQDSNGKTGASIGFAGEF